MFRAIAVLLIVSALAQSALAESDPGHLVVLNTRTFDLGIEVSKMRRDPDFVPMNEINWLKPILDTDPALGPVVFHLKMARPSNKTASWLWEWGDVAEDGTLASFHKFSGDIPELYQVPGFETRTSHENGKGSVAILPREADAEFSLECMPDNKTGDPNFCVLVASYPPDPLIYLKARLYYPPPDMIRSAPLHAIAARMREIAYCLDVTERPLEVQQDGLPKLHDCRRGPGA